MVTKADLQPGQAYAFLYCRFCEAQYSADSGDYWNYAPDYIFTCHECDEPMILARERCSIEEVTIRPTTTAA